jgi:hypothetical protein
MTGKGHEGRDARGGSGLSDAQLTKTYELPHVDIRSIAARIAQALQLRVVDPPSPHDVAMGVTVITVTGHENDLAVFADLLARLTTRLCR